MKLDLLALAAVGCVAPDRAAVERAAPAASARAPTVMNRPNDYDFGWAVDGGGDVNADGYDDLVVGAIQAGPNLVGRAYLFLGGPNGLSTVATATLDAAAQGGVADYFGWSAAIAGDTNGDGFDDVIVGAPYGGAANNGEAYVYYGAVGGIGVVPTALTASGNGDPVHALGDVNGDGFDDVGAGTRVYVGAAAGVNTAPATILLGVCQPAGDLDADGFDDVLSANTATSVVSVRAGGAGGLSPVVGTWTGTDPAGEFGRTAAIGDVNGDGYGDAWVGGRYASVGDPFTGEIALYVGGATVATTPVVSRFGAPSDEIGHAFGRVGDFNGDGFDDVGAARSDGTIELILGAPDPTATPAITFPPPSAGFGGGDASVGGGDFDGDGLADLVMGWPYSTRVRVVYGYPDADRDGVSDADDVCDGGNDANDADADGIPDDCDDCVHGPSGIDGDGDGVCDGDDLCLTGNDADDGDGDGVPDACDVCPGDDVNDDDADGVPDGCDQCPGFDDAIDEDGDGTPSGCDPTPYAAVLSTPSPGTVGVPNTFTVSGMAAATQVLIVSGQVGGTSAVPGCPGLTVPFGRAHIRAFAFTNASGAAIATTPAVPASAAGDWRFVAVQEGPCLLSNVVQHTF